MKKADRQMKLLTFYAEKNMLVVSYIKQKPIYPQPKRTIFLKKKCVSQRNHNPYHFLNCIFLSKKNKILYLQIIGISRIIKSVIACIIIV